MPPRKKAVEAHGEVVATVPEVAKAAPAQEIVVLSEMALSKRSSDVITERTPEIYIRERVIRGGRKAKYVPGGYFTRKLNEAFGPINWSWEVIEHGETARKLDKGSEGEVWVRGRLTVHDHVRGYKVFKDGFGQHGIYAGVPYGDTLKSATTDALKKAATQGFGIALDVYYSDADEGKGTGEQKSPKADPKAMFERAVKMIAATTDAAGLIDYDGKLAESKTFSEEQKKKLHAIISARVDALDNKQNPI